MEKRSPDRFEIGMMELPKGTISVRNLAYLALIENDQSSVESRICEMRYVSNHVACLLFCVFNKALGRASIRTSM